MKPKRKASPGIFNMAFRNIGRRPRRSVLSAFAIALAALSMVLIFSFLAGIRVDMEKSIRRYFTGDVLIQHKNYDRSVSNTLGLFIPAADELASSLLAKPGVRAASPRIQSSASVFREGEVFFFPFLGMDFAADPIRLDEFLTAPAPSPGRGQREAWISTGLADRLKLQVGEALTLVTQTLRGSSNGMTFRVTGIVKPDLSVFAGPYLFTDIATARRLVHLPEGATAVLVAGETGGSTEALAGEVRGALVDRGLDEIVAQTWDRSSSMYAFLGLAEVIYNFIGLFFFCLASTVIINTMLMVVLERSREIGTLAALGMDRSTLRRLFLAESAILSGLGSATGVAAGCLLTLILGQVGLDFTSVLQGLNLEIHPVIRPVLEFRTPFVVFLGATLVAVVFTSLPVLRVNRMRIVDAIRSE